MLEQLWEALGVLPSSVLDHVLELVVPPLVGAFAVRTGRLLPSSALALVPSFPSFSLNWGCWGPPRCLLRVVGSLVAGQACSHFCSVMLVGLADILASPRGYHLYLRIVVHLGHVLGIHLLLVVEDEMETVSSSAFFSWLSAEEGASHSIFFTFSCSSSPR